MDLEQGTTHRYSLGRGIAMWALWLVFTAVGWLGGFLFLDALPPAWETFPLCHGMVMGGVLGVPQWVLIRNRVHRASRWIWASLVGWSAGAYLPFIVLSVLAWVDVGLPGAVTSFMRHNSHFYGAVVWGAPALVAGMLQAWVLRHRVSRLRWLWPIVSCGAYTLAGAALENAGMFALFVLPWSGALAGAIGGMGIVLLLSLCACDATEKGTETGALAAEGHEGEVEHSKKEGET